MQAKNQQIVGRHTVTTRNKEEAIKTGKIYLSDVFYHYISKIRIKKPKRCKECNSIINISLNRKKHTFENLGYCSQWCLEKDKINKNVVFKGLPKLRYCHLCGNTVESFWDKNKNKPANVYPKYCSECRIKFGIGASRISNKKKAKIRENYPHFK